MAETKIELTEQLRKRIKEEQEKKGFKNGDMADHLGIKESTYRNYIRLSKGNRFIKITILHDIASFLGLTLNDLIGDEKKTEMAIDASEYFTLRRDVAAFLRNNTKTLESLHIIFCELTSHPQEQKVLIDGINVVANLLKESLRADRRDDLSPRQRKRIQDALEYDHPVYTQCLICFSNGKEAYRKRRIKDALDNYMIILNEYVQQTNYVKRLIQYLAEDAYEEVEKLAKSRGGWKRIPEELKVMGNTSFTFIDKKEIKEAILNYGKQRETFDDSPKEEIRYRAELLEEELRKLKAKYEELCSKGYLPE